MREKHAAWDEGLLEIRQAESAEAKRAWRREARARFSCSLAVDRNICWVPELALAGNGFKHPEQRTGISSQSTLSKYFTPRAARLYWHL